MYQIKVLLEKQTEADFKHIGFAEEKFLIRGEQQTLIEGYRLTGADNYSVSRMIGEETVQHGVFSTSRVLVVHYAVVANKPFRIQQWSGKGRKSRLVAEDKSGIMKDSDRINLADVMIRKAKPETDVTPDADEDDDVDPEFERQALAAGIGVDLSDVDDEEDDDDEDEGDEDSEEEEDEELPPAASYEPLVRKTPPVPLETIEAKKKLHPPRPQVKGSPKPS